MKLDDIDIAETVERRDRNWRIEIFCELERGMNFLVRCHREVILVKDGKMIDTGGLNGEKKYDIQKTVAEIAADTVTLPAEYGGITLTGAQVAVALEMISDKYSHPFTDDNNA